MKVRFKDKTSYQVLYYHRFAADESFCRKRNPSMLISEIDIMKNTYRRSQILIVPSSLPVTSHLPSLWKDTEVTFMVCPSNVTS